MLGVWEGNGESVFCTMHGSRSTPNDLRAKQIIHSTRLTDETVGLLAPIPASMGARVATYESRVMPNPVGVHFPVKDQP